MSDTAFSLDTLNTPIGTALIATDDQGRLRILDWEEQQLKLSAASARAVGLANGANPISVVIPCHRLIGADGTLTGYGGGLHRKQWLLQHEAAIP